MTPRKRLHARTVVVGALVAGVILGMAWLFFGRLGSDRSGADLQVLAGQAPGPNDDGLVIDVQPVDRAAALERLRAREGSPGRPRAFPSDVAGNPLCAGFLRVTIRNVSNRDLVVEAHGDDASRGFNVGVGLDDASGSLLLPPSSSAALSSLKSLGVPGDAAAVTLRAGEFVVREVPIWDDRGWASRRGEDDPPAEVYTARVVCSYTRKGDGAWRRASGPPVLVRVRPEDVRGWRRIQDALQGEPALFRRIIDAIAR